MGITYKGTLQWFIVDFEHDSSYDWRKGLRPSDPRYGSRHPRRVQIR